MPKNLNLPKMDFHADLMARSSNQLKDLLNLANQGPRIKHLFESASKFPPKMVVLYKILNFVILIQSYKLSHMMSHNL